MNKAFLALPILKITFLYAFLSHFCPTSIKFSFCSNVSAATISVSSKA